MDNMALTGLSSYDFWNGITHDNMHNSFNIDMIEIDNAFVISAFLPGVPKEKISIVFENDTLTIATTYDNIVKNDNKKVHFKECIRSSSTRSVRMERGKVDKENISAEYNNGELVITLNFVKDYDMKNNNVNVNIN